MQNINCDWVERGEKLIQMSHGESAFICFKLHELNGGQVDWKQVALKLAEVNINLALGCSRFDLKDLP